MPVALHACARLAGCWAGLAGVSLLLLLSPAAAQQDQDLQACHQTSNLDRKVAGCTSLINRHSGAPARIRATYLVARAEAYSSKGDYDRAIHDLDEAIRLDPKNLAARADRGRIESRRSTAARAPGNRVAVQDVQRLMPPPPEPAPLTMAAPLPALEKKIPPTPTATVKTNVVAPASAAKREAVGDVQALLPPPPEPAPLTMEAPAPAPEKKTPAAPTVTVKTNVAAPAPLSVAGPTPVPAIGAAEKRVALVIGNGNYRHATTLTNPANDATDIGQALRKLGFEVVEGRDLDKRGIEDKLREFSRKLAGAKLALFFYAGHGMQVAGKNYLVPVDAKLEQPGDLRLDTVDINDVLAQMEAEPRVNLVFLDACRDNPLARSFARSLGARSTSVGQGLAMVQSAIGTLIAYATQPDATALDGDGRNSPFTTALLKHIATPGLDIGTVMRRVRADVIGATSQRQVPWDHSSLIGEVVLAR